MQTGSPVSWFILLDSNFIPEVIIHFASASLISFPVSGL